MMKRTISVILVIVLLSVVFYAPAGQAATAPAAADKNTAGYVMAAAGMGHVVALKKDGTVWCWGNNSNGQLGDGTTLNRVLPVRVAVLKDVRAVCAGAFHSIALKKDGTVWSWGYNDFGQLGNGTVKSSPKPVQVAGLTKVTAIASGIHTAVALKNDGTVWCWGQNGYGQLGDGKTTDRSKPFQVAGLKDVASIASGGFHTLALKKDGTVWGWGLNTDGQLGDGSNKNRAKPVKVLALSKVTSIAAGGVSYRKQVSGSKAVFDDTSHSAALKADGTVWCWGGNDFGQLGTGSGVSRNKPAQAAGLAAVSAISSGGTHMTALKKDGTVWFWGNNTDGQAGRASGDIVKKPAKVEGIDTVVCVVSGGGSAERYAPKGVSVSDTGFTLAIKKDGTIWGWGGNETGQLGDGTTNKRTDFVQAGVTSDKTTASVTEPSKAQAAATPVPGAQSSDSPAATPKTVPSTATQGQASVSSAPTSTPTPTPTSSSQAMASPTPTPTPKTQSSPTPTPTPIPIPTPTPTPTPTPASNPNTGSTVTGTTAVVTAAKVSGKTGDTVEVPVNIRGVSDLSGGKILIDFNKDIVTYTGYSSGAVISKGLVIFNTEQAANGQLIIVWVTLPGFSGDGTLFTLKFKLKGGAGKKIPIGITIDGGHLSNSIPTDINVSIENGEVSVTN